MVALCERTDVLTLKGTERKSFHLDLGFLPGPLFLTVRMAPQQPRKMSTMLRPSSSRVALRAFVYQRPTCTRRFNHIGMNANSNTPAYEGHVPLNWFENAFWQLGPQLCLWRTLEEEVSCYRGRNSRFIVAQHPLQISLLPLERLLQDQRCLDFVTSCLNLRKGVRFSRIDHELTRRLWIWTN